MKSYIPIMIILLFISISFAGLSIQLKEIKTDTKEIVVAINSNRGILAYWSFDEGAGNVAHDSSGNGFDGTIYGATWINGYSSYALNFNGIDSYVDLDTYSQDLGFNKADDYEISAWVQTETTSLGVIYCISNSVSSLVYTEIAIDSDGSFIFRVGTEECTLTLTSTANYNDGEWHFVDGKWYGDTVNPTMELYVDSELEDTLTEWQCPFNAIDFETVKIGRKSSDDVAFDYFDGIIDEIKVYRFSGYVPPSEPSIKGEDKGKIGTEYEYTFNSEDPDNDELRYHIDWGDGNQEWTGYYLQGTDAKVNHTYEEIGTYPIKAYAQDEHGADGPESTLEVTMPKSFISIWWIYGLLNNFPLLQRFLGWLM